MSLKSETTELRICGNCRYAGRRLEPNEIRFLAGRVHFNEQHLTNLVISRRYTNPLRDVKVLCRRENINVGLLDDACAFWRPHRQHSQL